MSTRLRCCDPLVALTWFSTFCILAILLINRGTKAMYKEEISSASQGTAFVVSMMRNVWSHGHLNSTLMRIFVINSSTRKIILHVDVEPTISYSLSIEPKMTKQIKVTSKMKHEKIGIFNSVHIGTNGNVSVLVINNGLTRDGFMAIPIEAFGMVYTVVTLVGQPVFHVLSSTDDTEVLIQFNDWSALEYGRRAEFVLTFGKKRILPKSIIMVTIKKRYQYFQIHDCGSDKYGKTDFTGTRVSSLNPIGVISGNCETSSKGEYHFMSHVEDMLSPMSSWGFHHYFLSPNHTTDTRLRILSQTPTMNIKIVTNSSTDMVIVTENDDYVERFVESGAQVLISSDVPICVVMFTVAILDYESGDLAMVQLVPSENWLNWYYISIPDLSVAKLRAEMIILILTKDLPGLNIDFKSSTAANVYVRGAKDRPPRVITTLPGFSALIKQLDDSNIHVVYHMDGRKFGCYVKIIMTTGHMYVAAGATYRNVEQVSHGSSAAGVTYRNVEQVSHGSSAAGVTYRNVEQVSHGSSAAGATYRNVEQVSHGSSAAGVTYRNVEQVSHGSSAAGVTYRNVEQVSHGSSAAGATYRNVEQVSHGSSAAGVTYHNVEQVSHGSSAAGATYRNVEQVSHGSSAAGATYHNVEQVSHGSSAAGATYRNVEQVSHGSSAAGATYHNVEQVSHGSSAAGATYHNVEQVSHGSSAAGATYHNVEQVSHGSSAAGATLSRSQRYLYGEDELDNDCDGLVDEELLNKEDDDYDGKVDEDLGIINGSWSPWETQTSCSTRCRSTFGHVGFFRTCSQPEPSKSGRRCVGYDFNPLKDPAENCSTVNVKCPEECDNSSWYYGCERKCPEGCLGQCDRVTGRCLVCKPGYPMTSDYKCNLDFLPLVDNVTANPEGNKNTSSEASNYGHAQGEESSIPDLGWKIYATIIYIGVIIIIGIIYEIYKRYRKHLRCCRCKKGRNR
ncbi:CAunnamed protein product [Biomphalaria glabrata]|nr:CAunnamed protein product [Biomphalaria glabrata]